MICYFMKDAILLKNALHKRGNVSFLFCKSISIDAFKNGKIKLKMGGKDGDGSFHIFIE